MYKCLRTRPEGAQRQGSAGVGSAPVLNLAPWQGQKLATGGGAAPRPSLTFC